VFLNDARDLFWTRGGHNLFVMHVVLRRAVSKDRDLLRRLVAEYLFEFDGQTVPYRYFDAYWAEPDRLPFLIEAEAEVVGFCLVRLRGRDWTIAEFTVIPGKRREGIGREAVMAVLEEAGLTGATYVEATIHAEKTEALAFWRACGFRVVGKRDVTITRRDL
jgi:predicted acetyltransferase